VPGIKEQVVFSLPRELARVGDPVGEHHHH